MASFGFSDYYTAQVRLTKALLHTCAKALSLYLDERRDRLCFQFSLPALYNGFGRDSLRPSIISSPFLQNAFSSWYHWSSSLRTNPFSNRQFAASGEPSLLNSSAQTNL